MVWLQSAVPFIGTLLLLQRIAAQLTPQQYHLIKVYLTWKEAQSFCRVKYTDLATVNDMDDKDKLVNMLGSHGTYSWLGLRVVGTGSWMWSDGSESSFRFWLSGAQYWGNCASVEASQRRRWVGSNCNNQVPFVCQGGLKVKKMVIRMKLRSGVDLTDSTVSDALLKKLETHLKYQGVTDFTLSWRSDTTGLVFQRQAQLEVAETTGR